MARSDPPRRFVLTVLIPAVFAVLAALFSASDASREAAFDWMLSTTASPDAGPVRVVAIDSAALSRVGPWPWSRDRLAELVTGLAVDRPSVIVLDILLDGPDRADRTADPDAALMAAIADHPVVLTALLDDRQSLTVPKPPSPILITGASARLQLWQAEGALWPFAPLAKQAAGVGIGSMAGDGAGTVRTVPLLLAVGDEVYPGIAAETVRASEGAGGYIVSGQARAFEPAGRLGIGSVTTGLPRDGSLRFRASGPADWETRTFSAAEVLSGEVASGTFQNAIVLVGATAPELGILRPTAASPVTPGVQILADAVVTILSGTAPLRPDFAPMSEMVARSLLAIVGLILGWRLPPGRAIGTAGLAAGLWVGGCLAALHSGPWLLDPISPPVVLLAAAMISSTATAVMTRRRANEVVARFRQRLAPEIVNRIVGKPGLSRVDGERRVVTFLFTDIEGFTAMAAGQSPEAVVALLDDYFRGVTAIITDAGGTIDKYVGDAVHAMFNAPNDLADHASRAIEAAHRIRQFTEDFRLRNVTTSIGLGRTRIGIETGEVLVGDVGGEARRDYTAYGTAINTASRLEALNAQLGTAICVGPAARAAAPNLRFVSHGLHDLKGLGLVEVYEPIQHDANS